MLYAIDFLKKYIDDIIGNIKPPVNAGWPLRNPPKTTKKIRLHCMREFNIQKKGDYNNRAERRLYTYDFVCFLLFRLCLGLEIFQ